jgi:hypothetical protein
MLMIRQTPKPATSVTQAKDRGKLLSLPVRISMQQKSDFQMVDRECDVQKNRRGKMIDNKRIF